MGKKSISGKIQSRDVSPNSIPRPQVEEYKTQIESHVEVGES